MGSSLSITAALSLGDALWRLKRGERSGVKHFAGGEAVFIICLFVTARPQRANERSDGVTGPGAWLLGWEIAHAACQPDNGTQDDAVHFWWS